MIEWKVMKENAMSIKPFEDESPVNFTNGYNQPIWLTLKSEELPTTPEKNTE